MARLSIQPFRATAALKGLKAVERAWRDGDEVIIARAGKGLVKSGLLAEARGKALSPLAPPDEGGGTTQNSIAAQPLERDSAGMRVRITAHATSNGEDYARKTHENMEYDGPDCGGSRTQRRGPSTIAKGESTVEPSDGTAGGKYLERVIRNKTDRYVKLVLREVQELLGGLS